MTRLTLAAAGFVLIIGAARAHAQDLERVRALYVAAAYEEALAAMPATAAPEIRLEVEQYRALCLLALGREEAAAAAVERIVREDPTYVPPARDTSPRMQALLSAARTRLLPGIVREVYAGGKSAFDARNDAAAEAAFTRVLAIIDSLPEGERRGLADLRLLAAEFLDLSVARTRKLAAGSATAPAAPEPPAPVVPGQVAPIAIDETLPPWMPPDVAARRTEYTGLLRVRIGEDGRVLSAAVLESSHPAYDQAALRAARRWSYRPATLDGRPVASQKDVQIRLVPR